MAFKASTPAAAGQIVHTPAGRGTLLDVMGTSVEVKVDAGQSAGALNLFEIVAPPGSFVPPHLHRREDETFFVLEGQLEAEAEGRVEVISAGGSIFLPRNGVHSWKTAGSTTCRFLVISNPSGMDRYFPEIATRPGQNPPTPEQLVAISLKYGIEFV